MSLVNGKQMRNEGLGVQVGISEVIITGEQYVLK